MKKKLMFFAAMLLVSVSAFAQSGETPLKGDVNEDGIVDVSDINAIIAIMKEGQGIGEREYYFSVGTTPVTASNYKIANNATQVTASTYEKQYEYTPDGSAFVYVLISDKYKVSFTNAASNAPVDFSEVTDVNIFGYQVYKTDNKVSESIIVNVEIITYYWYIGATNPSSIGTVQTNDELEGWREIGTSLNGWSFEVDNTNKIYFNDDGSHAYYIVIPNTLHLYQADNASAEGIIFTSRSCSISGYKAWQYNDTSYSAKGFIIHE